MVPGSSPGGPSDHAYRWLVHDRSGIFSEDPDRSIEALGSEVLKTPVRAPKADAYCERLIGSLRRECLDWFIPLNQRHLRMLARENGQLTTTTDDPTKVRDPAFLPRLQGCR